MWGGVWLMTHFTTSPVLIALMQTATTLPVVLVGLFAGALADIVHHRRLLLASQGLILGAAAALAVLTYTGLMNAPRLLGFTFVLGLGSILGTPAWQAINAELVPPDELPAAVTLSSVSYNLASAVGTALAGLIIAALGPAAVFLLNALANLYVEVVLTRWHPAAHQTVLPAERLVGAAIMPRVQRALPVVDQRVAFSTLALALVMVALGNLRTLWLLCLITTGGGVAWIMLISSFNVAAQEASPAWVRARALGAYLVVYQGGTAVGSLLWGVVAALLGAPLAISVAALGAALAPGGQRAAGPAALARLRAQSADRTTRGRGTRHGAD
jgi:hypothetical protein